MRTQSIVFVFFVSVAIKLKLSGEIRVFSQMDSIGSRQRGIDPPLELFYVLRISDPK